MANIILLLKNSTYFSKATFSLRSKYHIAKHHGCLLLGLLGYALCFRRIGLKKRNKVIQLLNDPLDYWTMVFVDQPLGPWLCRVYYSLLA